MYWETWDNEDGTHTVHWGELGDRGEEKIVTNTCFRKAEVIVQSEIDTALENGFSEVEDQYILLVEYSIDGMGTENDIERRHALEDRLNGTLGWTGLGHCDGGSIGSGKMEVCNFVVDFDLAKQVIENDLLGTEFENFSRIYDEEAE
jgi:hypothetical protein